MHQFTELFQNYYHKFVHFANSYLEDEAAAEDIVMDSFMYYWENKAAAGSIDNPQAYLLSTIKNKCLNALRAKKVRLKANDNIRDYNYRLLEASIFTLEACNPTELFSEEVAQMVDEAINSLPQQTKRIFVKSRFQGMSYKEIAEEMNTSVKNVEKHMTKALKILRVALKDYIPAILFLMFFK
ncbi:RNA polymerase sigma-70 factor [Dysgonomonas sp. 511]|uniref:RNA polymerase sigma-70 factor n=1 Tax=Dysgonomonas sp. 511 TaxID=2302930 RepID=UPI0013D6A6D4|nr:RNA polymerase sigma-70 factor [Dysgonomonas sp. 511]